MANTNDNNSIGGNNEYNRENKYGGSTIYKTRNNGDRIDRNTMVERCNKRSERGISYIESTKRDNDRIYTILDIRNNVVCEFLLGIFSCFIGTRNRIGINMATGRNKCSKYMGNTIVGNDSTIDIRIYIDRGTSWTNKGIKR